MPRLTLTRFDPEPLDAPTRWQVGYDVVLSDGRELYFVTTVYAAQIEDAERRTVLAAARKAIRPGPLALEPETQEDAR